MTKSKLPADAPSDPELEISKPKTWAAGLPSLTESIPRALREMGPDRSVRTLTAMNQKDGFDCMSCAWPDPPHRKTAEFCENGAKAVTWEATPLTVPDTFWAEHSVDGPAGPHRVLAGTAGPAGRAGVQAGREGPLPADQLGQRVRHHRRGAQRAGQPGPGRVLHQRPHQQRDGVRLPALRAGVRHQQPARLLQHVPRVHRHGDGRDHRHRQVRPSLRGLREGRPDHHHGPEPGHQPPADAHRAGGGQGGRRQHRRRQPAAGGRADPLQEPAAAAAASLGRAPDLADQFLQIRLAGDMALLQAVSKRVLDAEAAAPGTVLDHEFLDRALPGPGGVPGPPGRPRRAGGAGRHRACASRRSTSWPTAT